MTVIKMVIAVSSINQLWLIYQLWLGNQPSHFHNPIMIAHFASQIEVYPIILTHKPLDGLWFRIYHIIHYVWPQLTSPFLASENSSLCWFYSKEIPRTQDMLYVIVIVDSWTPFQCWSISPSACTYSVYVYMYRRVYMDMLICMCIYIYVYSYTCRPKVNTLRHTYMHASADAYMRTFIHASLSPCVHASTRTYVHTFMQIYIYIHTAYM